MPALVNHKIHQNNFWLSPQRCIYWEEQQSLIVCDLHVGKTGHFRKSGIAVPQSVFKEDLQRLFSEIQHYQPKQLLIIGDLFHSKENKEMELFKKWRNDLSITNFILIKGNHDILKDSFYENAGIEIHKKQLCIEQFLFTHDNSSKPCEDVNETFVFSGHVHPGVLIRGVGKQSLKFPCFYFNEQFAILPAFSKFTGLALLEPKQQETVFAIVNQTVIPVKKAK